MDICELADENQLIVTPVIGSTENLTVSVPQKLSRDLVTIGASGRGLIVIVPDISIGSQTDRRSLGEDLFVQV